ncbi:hypothetical protein Zmor_012423 [Zophobas morio]|uniref:LIM zinc-binding domain-containing protein n=1 Tax=Zophobas morio TaxID=2755281 RepID=A0AA38LXT7_9CUCU|nr:hypothetical protein Zmor_012423 [Zophobas morio]
MDELDGIFSNLKNDRGAEPTETPTTELDLLLKKLEGFKVIEELDVIKDKEIVENTAPIDKDIRDVQIKSDKELKQTVCFRCQKPIIGQPFSILGKDWHETCFCCYTCKSQLNSKNFFDYGGLPYCRSDYNALVFFKCAYCGELIENMCVHALGRVWHPDHFFCSQCGRVFKDENYREVDGKAYCEEDYFRMFAPKCKGCGLPVMDQLISAMDCDWHEDCFRCATCNQLFEEGLFYEHAEKPYCYEHFCEVRGMVCEYCGKPISDDYITVSNKRRFHRDHFLCNFCHKRLDKVASKERESKFYCLQCHVRLFE